MSPTSRTTRRDELPFWVLSVVLHAVVLTFVLVFSPVREIVFRRKQIEEPEVITRGDELEVVIEAIRDRTVEKLAARVALLEEGQDRMARNFVILNEHFQPFEARQRATARDRMSRYVEEVSRGQSELLKILRGIDLENPGGAVERAVRTVAGTLSAQEEIRRGIVLLEIGGEDLPEKQAAAEEAQYSTGQFLRFLDGDLIGMERETDRLALLTEELASRKAALAEAERAAAEVAPEAAAAAERRQVAEAAWRELPRTVQGEERDRVRKALDLAKRQEADARKRLGDQEGAVRKAGENVTRSEAEIEKTRARLEELRESRSRHLSEAHGAQERARLLQRRVLAVIASASGEGAP